MKLTNEEIREQLELALENLDSYTPEENVKILMEMLNKVDVVEEDEFMPCPFCGTEPEADLAYGSSQVLCPNEECGVFMVMLNEPFLDGILKRWNTRVQ